MPNTARFEALPATAPDQHNWRYYLSPPEAWEAMLEACRSAKKSIEFEQYILENDEIGRRFLDIFIEKAAAGLKIFIICDGLGSASLCHSPLINRLREKGGNFHFYHRPRLFQLIWPGTWFPRTHIKTLLIDSELAFVGGVCVASRMQRWRDTQMSVTGPVTKQIRIAFDQAEKLVAEKQRAHAPRNREKHEFTYLQSHPLLSWSVIYHQLIDAIARAKTSIDLSSPFFAPNRRFKRLLFRAAKRGVKIRLLLPEHSDVFSADWLALSYAGNLLRHGVEIYYYRDTVLHQKTVTIDDDWATVGSTNMDVVSFFLNRESNIVIRNKKAVAELTAHFDRDLQHSFRLTEDMLADTPLWKRVAGYLMRGIKGLVEYL